MPVCPRCQSERLVKNGSAAGKPKKQCTQCGHQFTRMTPRETPLAMKINAVLWYLSGVSMHRIAFLLRVSAQAVRPWIHALAQQYQGRPEPTGSTIVLELDEMWHYLKTKRCKLWSCSLVYSLIGHRIGYSHSQEVSRCKHKRFL